MVFGGDLFFDWALHVGGKNTPGVGFDFPVRAEVWHFFGELEGIARVLAGGLQRLGGFGIERDVEVDAPLLCIAAILGIERG